MIRKSNIYDSKSKRSVERSVYWNTADATLYASPYVVATRHGYTKHYYAESERVASKIGGGGLHGLTMTGNVFQELLQPDLPFGHPPCIPNSDEFKKKWEIVTKYAIEVARCLDSEIRAYAPLESLAPFSDILNEEPDCYWYHPDHLGSSSWITGSHGEAVQHLHYLPFGETFVSQRSADFDAMYTFSGKEKDTETGYSYFGARYYSSELSIWLSVDPMSDKYPHQSNYVYCSNNPIRIIDPNGEDEWDLARDGTLTKRENGRTDIDVVYATNSKGETVSRSYKANTINQDPKDFSRILHEGTEDATPYTTDYMSFDNRETATDFFEFAAENTDVEWGFNSTDSHTYVGTSHQSGFNAIPIPKGNNLIQIHSHSKPSDRLSSGFEGSDVDMMYKHPGTFKVYEAFKKSYISIDPTNSSIKHELSHNLQKNISILKKIIPL